MERIMYIQDISWRKLFRYDKVDYQQRAISFLAERIISAYLASHMNLVCIQTYNHKEKV